MPRASTFYFWSQAEKDLHNTERHQIFKNELYKCVSWSKEEFFLELGKFKKKHPELFIKNNKEVPK